MNKRQTILIVDDIAQNVHLLHGILGSEYRILFSTDGQGALEIARNAQPDIILLDIMMPDINGYEICKKLKEQEITKDIPIIILTALSDFTNETEGLKLGAIDFIRKPFNPAVLKLRIHNHLELKQNRDELFYLSNIDRLTGIANRTALFNHLERELARSIRASRSLGLIMLDIDYFKLYNDHYGHVAGDGCLNAVAGALQDNLRRPGDLVGRYGGEEFLCVLPEIDTDGVKEVAERILGSVAELKMSHAESPIKPYVTISAGCYAHIPTKDDQLNDLIDQADKALYQAKNSGRNQVQVYAHT